MNERDRAKSRPVEPVPWWALTIGLVLAIAVIALAQFIHGIGELLLVVGAFGALGAAGWLWGYDSRDGNDWRPADRP